MINLHKTFFLGLTIFVLAGCIGPLVHLESVDKQTIDRVQVFADKSILQNPNVRILGVVDATSCRNLAWEPPASIENCTMQMQMRAGRLGANGIVLGSAEDKIVNFLSTGINRNCWSTVDCTGVAVILE
jgi:hypothetical protein